MQGVKEKALELLRSGVVQRVLGWRTGEFFYDLTPGVFIAPEEVEQDFVYNIFSGANLSKYLIAESKKEGKIAVFLKPCDSFSFVQLQKEHRINRENIYAVGVQCDGKCDGESLRAAGCEGLLAVEGEEVLNVHTLYGEKSVAKKDALLGKCRTCKSKHIADFDELIGQQGKDTDSARFEEVTKLEAMTPDERFNFWQGELSKCIRCNACRNVCPACSCRKCVFDSTKFDSAQKANSDSFEEKIQTLQAAKKDLADRFVEGNSGSITTMSGEEIMSLFSED